MRICISVNRNLLPYKAEYVTNQFINGGENGLSAEKQRPNQVTCTSGYRMSNNTRKEGSVLLRFHPLVITLWSLWAHDSSCCMQIEHAAVRPFFCRFGLKS